MAQIRANTLTKEQQYAIKHERGALLIVAGPGAGKTEVMTQRVAHLINKKNVSPEKILVVTFTNKAADELKDRIQAKVEVNVDEMQISTIHSFCRRILIDNIDRAKPLKKTFKILDNNQQFLFVYANRKNLELDNVKKGRIGEFVRSVISAYNKCTEYLVAPNTFVSEVDREVKSEQDEKKKDYLEEWLAVTESYAKYCQLLEHNNFVDFSFLLKHAYDLLNTNPEVLESTCGQFEHILIDEYQDTNRLQDLLLRKIAKPEDNICVVGDDDQSIYRFRGATVQNFFDFRDRYDALSKVELTRNFRSTKKIVNASAILIANNPQTDRIPKDLFTKNEMGDDILLIHEATAPEEAEAVADRLISLKENGCINDFSDVAILFRSVRSYAGPYLEVFREREIPYVVIGDGKFLERQDVRDLLHLFSFLANKKEWATKYLLSPTVGLSSQTKKVVKAYTGELHLIKTAEELKDIGIKKKDDVQKLLLLLDTKRRALERKHDDILTLFFDLLEATGCFQEYNEKNNEEALRNLALFASIINDFDDHAGSNNIFYFLRYIDDLGYGAIDEERLEKEGAAKIMTVHQAKGLEFLVVVLAAAMEGRFPLRFRAEKYPLPESCIQEACRLTEDIHMMDERKLFYVGMTRAKRLLIIAASDKVTKRGNGPSRFIKEICTDEESCVSQDLRSPVCKPESTAPRESYKKRTRLSYSEIEYYMSCPLRYKFLTECGFKVPQATYYAFGIALHNTLQDIHSRALEGLKIDANLVARLYEDNWISFGHRGRKAEKEYKDAGLRYVKTYFQNHKDEFKKINKVEELYAAQLPEFVISGRVDLLRKDDKGGFEIVDFKTRKVKWSDYDPKLQLSIYALVCEQEGQLIDSLCVHYLHEDDRTFFPWNDEELKTTGTRLDGILKDIAEREYPPKVGRRCRSCEFKNMCTAFLVSPMVTRNSAGGNNQLEDAI